MLRRLLLLLLRGRSEIAVFNVDMKSGSLRFCRWFRCRRRRRRLCWRRRRR